MKNNVTSTFKTINQIVEEFTHFLIQIEEKINIIKKLSGDVCYNVDYQNSLCKNNFLSVVISDIYRILQEGKSETLLKDYIRIFFLLFHNLIVGSSHNQSTVFKHIFTDQETFNKLNQISNYIIEDNRFKKYILSIFFSIFMSNENNLKLLDESHINYFIFIFSSLDNTLLHQQALSENKDLNEINDWIHILLKHILKNETFIINDHTTLCSHLLNSAKAENKILFLELFRDYVDYAKENKSLSISLFNLSIIVRQFCDNLSKIHEFIQNTKFEDFQNTYKLYMMSNEDSVAYSFREFICFVDLLSVFLIHEEETEFREQIRKTCEEHSKELIYTFHFILSTTDKFYDDVFKRNKSLTKEESQNVPVLEERNILYGFQTNIMKFLSNFALKNEELKKKFANDPITLMYFLNHMKMDKCNPFKKEWTVLFVKAVTEGNQQIQSLIRDLRPQQLDPLLKDYIVNKGNVDMGSQNDIKEEYCQCKHEDENCDEDV